MDQVKDAFQKVKQDIALLKQEVDFLSSNLSETREKLVEMCEILNELNRKIDVSTHKPEIQTTSTHSSTLRQEIEGLKPQNLPISTGNGGVPTDRQTDRQTDKIKEIPLEKPENTIENAIEILDSLDNIKKELRLKFKRLTEQELLVFSIIYQLEEEQGHTDYKTVAKRLNLSESSVRDYVQRIIKKGISVDKKRINNKNIQLSISSNLKKIASLSTILKLRDI